MLSALCNLGSRHGEKSELEVDRGIRRHSAHPCRIILSHAKVLVKE